MMVSPEHVNAQKPEDKQTPDPAGEQQVLPAGKKKRRWLEPLLRGIAIVVSLLGGVAAVSLVVVSYRPFLELGYENSSADQLWYLRLVVYLLVFLVALGSAVLFRSGWGILLVPLAIGLGAVLTFYLSGQIAYDLLHYDDVVTGVAVHAFMFIPGIALIAACIGSYLSWLWMKRQPL